MQIIISEAETMSTKTSIEWTERTWNPTVGCTKISPGCAHCYAEVMAKRLKAMGVKGYITASHERRVAEDRRDCYWLYVVTNCATEPKLQDSIKDPARFPWKEVTKVAHYQLEMNAMTTPMMVREEQSPYGAEDP